MSVPCHGPGRQSCLPGMAYPKHNSVLATVKETALPESSTSSYTAFPGLSPNPCWEKRAFGGVYGVYRGARGRVPKEGPSVEAGQRKDGTGAAGGTGAATAGLAARGAAAAPDGRGEEPQDRGCAPGGSGCGGDHRPGGPSPLGAARAQGWGLTASPTPPGCRHALPSLFPSPGHTGPSPRAAGHRREGWEFLAFLPVRQPMGLAPGSLALAPCSDPFLFCGSKVLPHFSRR